MLEIDFRQYILHYKHIWFADSPYDVERCAFVAFHECKDKVDRAGFDRQEHTTLVIDLSQDLDRIWHNMDKKSCRYDISRAEREGVIIKTDQNINEFLEIERSFRRTKRLGAGWLNYSEYLNHGTVFTAEVDGEVLAGRLYLEDEDNMRELVGASKRLEVSKDKSRLIGYASRLMEWEAIQYAKHKSIREFDFGGYYTGGNPSDPRNAINFFKRSFGGKLSTHYIYRKYYAPVLKLARSVRTRLSR